MFGDYKKDIREKITREREAADAKAKAFALIEQIIIIEKAEDAEYVKLLADKGVFLSGESAVIFYLGVLKELIEKI